MAIKVLGTDGYPFVIFHSSNSGRIFAMVSERRGDSAIVGSLSVGSKDFSYLLDFGIERSVPRIGVNVVLCHQARI